MKRPKRPRSGPHFAGRNRVQIFHVTIRSLSLYSSGLRRPYRLAVRTPPFHGGSSGSIPDRVAIFSLHQNCGLPIRRVCDGLI